MGCGGSSCRCCSCRADPGVVHAWESRGHEARSGMGEVSIKGWMVHCVVEAPVLIVLSEHVEAITLLHLGTLLLPPMFQGQRVSVFTIKVMRLAVPVGALGLVEARRRQPVQRVIPQKQVPGQRVPSVNVQAPVGVPHWVPVEGGVGEPVSSWDGADTHKGRHHSSSLQTADGIDGVDASHAHGHRHRGGRMKVWCGRCLCWVLTWPLCDSILLLLPLLLHFHLTVLLLVLVRQLYLLLQDVPAQATVGTFEAGLADVGRCRPSVGHFVL